MPPYGQRGAVATPFLGPVIALWVAEVPILRADKWGDYIVRTTARWLEHDDHFDGVAQFLRHAQPVDKFYKNDDLYLFVEERIGDYLYVRDYDNNDRLAVRLERGPRVPEG